ncbi:uncharacterized protein LOC120720526 isoform X1 [Simochromis diagramma]|uniref:uncharacterized protein LOC120720526 isoform X1 n=1 Tax=Simochromis diagramma TaxID=43689 RepID=UPI001A7E8AD6|nr:uncharacterized protein LOC120720526 isoform X1 [Simochromis diagramma]
MPATHRAFALISLLSFSAAAPTVDDCNQLTQPLQANELHQILGRWIFIQGLAGNGSLGDTLRFVESTWMVLNTTSDSQTLQAEIAGRVVQQLDQSVQPQVPKMEDASIPTNSQGPELSSNPSSHPVSSSTPHLVMKEDRCLRNVQNMSLVDGKDLEFYMKIASSYHRFLQTCSDCLLMHTYDKVANHQLFYLFARNKTVTASDLETFRKQGECLRFPTTPKFNYNPNNGHEQLSKHFTTYRTVYDCVRDK